MVKASNNNSDLNKKIDHLADKVAVLTSAVNESRKIPQTLPTKTFSSVLQSKERLTKVSAQSAVSKTNNDDKNCVVLIKKCKFSPNNVNFDNLRKLVFETNKDCKFINFNFSPSGILFLKFYDENSCELFLNDFNRDNFGDDAEASKYDPGFNKNLNLSVILRNVPLKFSDGEIVNHLIVKHPSVAKAERFKKKGKRLPVVKVDFENGADKKQILISGISFEYYFLAAEDYIQKKLPIRCSKCQIFGHKMQACKSKKFVCAKCGGNHETISCNVSDKMLCVNSNSCDHSSDDKLCPFYIEVSKDFNFFL